MNNDFRSTADSPRFPLSDSPQPSPPPPHVRRPLEPKYDSRAKSRPLISGTENILHFGELRPDRGPQVFRQPQFRPGFLMREPAFPAEGMDTTEESALRLPADEPMSTGSPERKMAVKLRQENAMLRKVLSRASSPT